MNRSELEQKSIRGARLIDEVGDYKWVRVLDTFEMYIHKDDKSVSPHLEKEGFWESWITLGFMKNIKPGTVLFDIGANTGYSSLLGLSRGAIVASFEPNPVYSNMMEATKERNSIGNMWRIHNIALSDHDGQMSLHIPNGYHGSASLNDIPPGYPYEDITVQVKRFDDVYRGPGAGVQVLKMDAEGEEERIIDGAKGFLSKAFHKMMIIEYTPNAYSEEFFSELERNWKIYYIGYDGREYPASQEWVESQTDWSMLVLRSR